MGEVYPDKSVHFVLNGQSLEVPQETTILQVARDHGCTIPTLCYRDGCRPDGNCRACVVEIENERVLAPSCRRTVSEDMIVWTDSERVQKSRDTVLSLLAVEGGHAEGPTSAAVTESELSKWLDVFEIRPASPLGRASRTAVDQSHPGFTFDASVCINCDRCVRACQEEQVNGVIGVSGRGAETQIIFGLDDPVADSPCVGCGECVQACPTGALRLPEAVVTDDQKKVDSVCPYCGVGCALTFSVQDDQIIAVEGRDGPANHRRLCVKGRFGFDYIANPNRLTRPLIRRDDVPKDPELLQQAELGQFDWRSVFREATWDEALDMAANGLRHIRDQHGPNALAGFGSAKGSNEEAYLFQKFVRTAFGSNHVDHCTRLCHASSVAALLECIGSGAVSNQVQDILEADVALLIGCNPTVNHPVAATWMKNAADQGTQLIVADPRVTEISRHATDFLQIKPGSDIALVNAMLHVIVDHGLIDELFVEHRVGGFDQFKKHIQQFSPDVMSPICGVPVEQIVAAATRYATAERAMIFWGMGVSQHTHGTDNVRALIALAGITGQFGRPGTGLHPLRGQNNVQGASDAGLIPMMFPNYQRVTDPEARGWFESFWGQSLSATAGLTVVEIMSRVEHPETEAERMRGLYVMGENPAMSDPDLTHARSALARLEHLVVQDIFLTETALLADVVLPASAWPEKVGTVTNTDRMVQLGQAAVQPPGDAQADLWIIQQLAKRFGLNWQYAGTYHGVASVFEEMRTTMGSPFAGISWKRLQREQTVVYPCESEDQPGQGVVFIDRFPTESGRMRLVPTDYRGPDVVVDSEYPMAMITGRVLEHWHTGSMTRRASVLHQINPVPVVSMHPEDASAIGVQPNGSTAVLIRSRQGEVTACVQIDEAVAVGTLFMPFAFYEAAANVLTADKLDPTGKIPEFKHTPVSVQKTTAQPVVSGYT